MSHYRQIRREAQAAAAHHPQGHVDVSTVGKHGLPMVDACIKEAQRLYPVAPFVVRYLSSDLKLKDGERFWSVHLTSVADNAEDVANHLGAGFQ